MPMESETINLLISGFSFILIIYFAALIGLYIKTKKKGLIWFVFQIILLVFAFYHVIEFIVPNKSIPDAMISEENSLTIGCAGIYWAASMIVMIIGIFNLCNVEKKD